MTTFSLREAAEQVKQVDDLAAVEADQMSVIVPALNEAAFIQNSILAILDGLPSNAEVIIAFNGCTDGSELLLDSLDESRVRILNLQEANKALAIRAAEKLATKYPRFFVDADVSIKGSELAQIATVLRQNAVELASPRLVMDFSDCSPFARAASEIWTRLPHAKHAAFQQVIGVSRSGRARWGEMPDLIADDTFITSRMPLDRRLILEDVAAVIRPPANLWSFFRVRIRSEKGVRQLRACGIDVPHEPGQRRELLRLALHPMTCLSALVYVCAVLAARALLLIGYGGRAWFQDRSSRTWTKNEQDTKWLEPSC